MFRRTPLKRVALAAVAGVVLAAPAAAQTPRRGESEDRAELALKLARARSDNIRRASVDEESGSYTAYGFVAGFARDGTRFDASLDADVEQREYSIDSIEDDIYGSLDGRLDFAIVPERFWWSAEENLGQTRIDPFAPDSPDNREQVKAFSTGPRIAIPLAMRTTLEAGVARSSVSYDETSRLDRDTDSADVALVRVLANRARFSVVLDGRDIQYDLPGLDAELQAAYVRYERELATGSAELAVGSNRVEFAGRKSSEPFLQLGWAREVGSFSRVSLSAANRLVDAAESFRQASADDRLDDVLATADVYENSVVRVEYVVDRPRALWAFGVSAEKQAYQTDMQFDSDQRRLDVRYTRRVSETLDLSVEVYRGEREFDLTGQVDDDEGARVSLTKLLGTRFELDFAYQRDSRAGFLAGTYEESLGRVTFLYHVGGRPAR